jgi:hypothetical protein
LLAWWWWRGAPPPEQSEAASAQSSLPDAAPGMPAQPVAAGPVGTLPGIVSPPLESFTPAERAAMVDAEGGAQRRDRAGCDLHGRGRTPEEVQLRAGPGAGECAARCGCPAGRRTRRQCARTRRISPPATSCVRGSRADARRLDGSSRETCWTEERRRAFGAATGMLGVRSPRKRRCSRNVIGRSPQRAARDRGVGHGVERARRPTGAGPGLLRSPRGSPWSASPTGASRTRRFAATTRCSRTCAISWKASVRRSGSISSRPTRTSVRSRGCNATSSTSARRTRWTSGPSAPSWMCTRRVSSG